MRHPLIARIVALSIALMLGAMPGLNVVRAQQPDYTAQCSNGIVVPDPQNNPGLVQDCAALLAVRNGNDTRQRLNCPQTFQSANGMVSD